METPLLIEQHFHGCYGVDFNTANKNQVIDLATKIIKEGIGYIFPTLVTDTVENIKRQISVIKSASEELPSDCAKICGIHLEGIFLNPGKKGIHDSDLFMSPSVDNFKLIEDDFIKIVTLAPEFSDSELFEYLRSKNIKIQAGHCIGGDLSKVDGVTHMFNAMSGITHRSSSTALSALVNDDIYCEIICDGVHVCDDALKLVFKSKPQDKIILISDCLPCTNSSLSKFSFAGSEIFYDGKSAKSSQGTIAGSTKLLPGIIKILGQKGLMRPQYVLNPYKYHGIEPSGRVLFNEKYEVERVDYAK